MQQLDLGSIGQFVYDTALDRYHFEAWHIINQYISILDTIEDSQSFVGDTVELPEGKLFILLTNNDIELLPAIMQELGLTPIDLQNWLNQFLDNSEESVLQLVNASEEEAETNGQPDTFDNDEPTQEIDYPLRDDGRESEFSQDDTVTHSNRSKRTSKKL